MGESVRWGGVENLWQKTFISGYVIIIWSNMLFFNYDLMLLLKTNNLIKFVRLPIDEGIDPHNSL